MHPGLRSLSSRFKKNIRCFSVLKTTVPENFVNFFAHTTQKDKYQDLSVNNIPKEEDILELSYKSLNFLQDQYQEGCEESLRLLQSLQTFSMDYQYRNFLLYGAPTDYIQSICFLSIVSAITGHNFVPTNNSSSLIKSMRIDYSKINLPMHTDFSTYDSVRPDIISILALESDGEIKTLSIDSDYVYQSISESSQYILSQPIFHKRANPKIVLDTNYTDEEFSIFSRDQQENLMIYFKLTEENLIYVDQTTLNKFPSCVDYKNSIDELAQFLRNPDPKKVKEFSLKTGDMLVTRNDPHSRVGSSENDRKTLVGVSYKKEEENNFFAMDKIQKCQQTFPGSSTENITASTLQQIDPVNFRN